jgi:hypothetical protein
MKQALLPPDVRTVRWMRVGPDHHKLMPVVSKSMAVNRHSTLVLVCTRCGRKYQAVTAAVAKRCLCGGPLKAEEPTRPEAKIA